MVYPAGIGPLISSLAARPPGNICIIPHPAGIASPFFAFSRENLKVRHSAQKASAFLYDLHKNRTPVPGACIRENQKRQIRTIGPVPIISHPKNFELSPKYLTPSYSICYNISSWGINAPEVTLLKKKYSLDYSVERDIDRVQAVKDILDTLDTDPTETELE